MAAIPSTYAEVETFITTLQRTREHRGHPVLALDGVFAGAEWALLNQVVKRRDKPPITR